MSILFRTFVLSKEINNAKVKFKTPDRWAKRKTK